jgi:DNA-binding protein HU-beta
VTKADIINEISKKTGLDKGDVSTIIESFFKVMKNSMTEGENIYIRGFGSFIIKKRAKKIARIISQDKPIVIDEHYIPSFKPAKIFINRVKESPKVKEKYISQIEKKDKRKTKTKK